MSDAATSPTRAVLLRAAHLIEANGWTAADGDVPGALCIDGAIGRASRELNVMGKRDAIQAVRQFTGAAVLFKWNDAPGRTKSDVLSALRGAASHV